MEDILHMDISAGIVLFNPDIERLKREHRCCIVQCTHVYLVDNGSKNISEVLEMLNGFNFSAVFCNSQFRKIKELQKHLISLQLLRRRMDMSGFSH